MIEDLPGDDKFRHIKPRMGMKKNNKGDIIPILYTIETNSPYDTSVEDVLNFHTYLLTFLKEHNVVIAYDYSSSKFILMDESVKHDLADYYMEIIKSIKII
jgi:hypothetical protein